MVATTSPETSAIPGDEVGQGDALSEVVRASRVAHASGLGAGAWGFIAVRDAHGRGVWITRSGVGFDEVVVGDIVLVSSVGEVLAGEGEPDEELAVAREVLAARRDVNVVVHAHSLYASAFAATPGRLHALSHEGCHLVAPDVVRFRTDGAASDLPSEARAVASSLGSRDALLWSGHGLVMAGRVLGETVALAVYLEKACRLQLMVGRDGQTVSDDEVADKRAGQLRRPTISWEYLRRVMSTP